MNNMNSMNSINSLMIGIALGCAVTGVMWRWSVSDHTSTTLKALHLAIENQNGWSRCLIDKAQSGK